MCRRHVIGSASGSVVSVSEYAVRHRRVWETVQRGYPYADSVRKQRSAALQRERRSASQ